MNKEIKKKPINIDEKRKRLIIPIPSPENIKERVARYTVGVLDPIDRKLLELMSMYPKISNEDLAEAVGISLDRVKKRLVAPLFIRHLENIQATTLELLKKAQNKAMREAIKILNNDSNDPRDIRNKIEMIKTVMYPILNNTTSDLNSPDKIIFKTKIGESGNVIQEVINVEIAELKKEITTNGSDS